MDCFWCTIKEGELILKEHEAAKWLAKDELETVDWLPADIKLVRKIIVD
jgi:8-oxo-dGTP diphosphatase